MKHVYSLWNLTWKLVLFFAIATPQVQAEQAADDPNELASMAAESNRAVFSLQRHIESLRHKTDASVTWADPVFAVEYSNVPWNSWSLDDSPMSGVQFKVTQKITLPGKNLRRMQEVQAQTQVSVWELEEKKNQLRAMVKKAYWKLALVRQLRKINERHIVLVEQFLAVVRVKYQVGKVGQHDLLSLQVLKKRLKDDLGDFDERQKQLTAAINSAMHRKVSVPITTPDTFEALRMNYTTSELVQLAIEYRPLLKQTKARAKWQRMAARKVEYERWPDITVWAGYRARMSAGADPGTDFFSLGVSVPLPFDYTAKADAQEAQYLSSAAEADDTYQAILDQIKGQVESSLATWQRAFEKARRYKTEIIPEADRTLKANLAAYQSDRADFASLYRAELELLNFERASKIAHASTHVEKSSLEAVVGAPATLEKREATP